MLKYLANVELHGVEGCLYTISEVAPSQEAWPAINVGGKFRWYKFKSYIKSIREGGGVITT